MHAHSEILVIEDEPDLRVLFRAVLELEGLSMLEASDADEALKLAHEHVLSLIFCDVHLGSTNGFHILRELKANPETAGIPVIMMSGGNDVGGAVAGGAEAFLAKPFTAPELLALVRETLHAAA